MAQIKINNFKGLFSAYMLQSEKVEIEKATAVLKAAASGYAEWQQYAAAVTVMTAAARNAIVVTANSKAAAEKAARKAATDARKERQAEAAKAAAANRRSIAAKTTKMVNMIDGEYEIPIEAIYPVQIAAAAETRSIAVYGGKRLAVQAFEVAVDYNGGAEVYPQIQEQADCLLMREGFLPEAKYQLGYSTVTIVDKKGNSYNETWLCRQKGLTEALVPVMITGNPEEVKKIQIALLQSRRPIIYMIDRETGKPNILVWATKKVAVGKDKVPMATYVNITALHKEVVKAGVECHNIKFVQNLMLEDANDIDVKAGIKAPAIRIYTLGFDSPSTQRKGYFVLMKANIDANNIENEAAYTATRNKIVNTIGANVLDLMDSLSMNEDISADKMVKKVGRASLVFTNSARGAKPHVMAFFTGKFKELGIEFADGFGFIAENLIRKTLCLHGFKDVRNVCGLGFQNRVVASKGYTLTVNNTVMRDLIWATLAKINPDNITIKNVVRVDIDNSEEVHNIALAIEKGEVKDKIVLVAPKGAGLSEVEYFADSNMLKAAFDFDKVLETSIMEMSHGSHGTYTSSQIVESAITVPDFHKTIMEIGKETIDKIFTMKIESSFTHKDVSNFDCFSDGPLSKLNHEFIFADEAKAKAQIQTMAKSAVNAINNIRFDIEGGYMKALPDIGGFFGQALLKMGEIYSPDLAKSANKICMIVRYPHTAKSEFVIVKIVGIDELKKRIMAMNISYSKSLWNIIRTLQKGQIILPSISDPFVVAKLGGSDFDGDGVMAITDDRILNMYSHLIEGAVAFKPEKATATLVYDKFSPEVSRLFGIQNGNRSTGEVVNHFYLLRSLLYDIDNSAFSEQRWQKFLDHILKPNTDMEKFMIADKDLTQEYGDESYLATYLLQDRASGAYDPKTIAKVTNLVEIANSGHEINNTEVDTFIASIIDNGISLRYLENLKIILRSLDPAGASIVGRIIDAVKTGEKVTVPFTFLSSFIRNGAKIDCAYDRNGQIVTISENIGFSDDWKNFKYLSKKKPIYYVTKNPVYFVKKDLVAYVNNKIVEAMKKINDTNSYQQVKGLTGAVGTAMAQLCTALMTTQAKTSLSDVVVPKTELSRYGVSLFRSVTAGFDYKIRYSAAKLCSAIYKDGKMDGFGRFYQTLGAETILSALNGRDVQVKTEIFARRNNIVGMEGEEINLVRGMSDKFFAADKITANGNLIFEKGKAYIVSSLRQMAEEAISASIAENKIVFKIKVVPGLDNVSGAAMVKLPLRNQVERLQRLAGDASSAKNVRYMASYKSVRENNNRTQLAEFGRLVVGDNNFVACYVYDYGFMEQKKGMNVKNNSIDKMIHGHRIEIDHVIMVKVGKNNEGYIFGRIC